MVARGRLLRRAALALIRPHLTIGGSHFGPRILLEVIAHWIPFVEIPRNYRPRVGTSSVTGSLWTAFWLGMRMIVLVLGYRFGFYQRERVLWHEGLMAGSMSQLASRLGSGIEPEHPTHADQQQRVAASQVAAYTATKRKS